MNRIKLIIGSLLVASIVGMANAQVVDLPIDPTLNAYIQGCLAQDFGTDTINISSYQITVDTITVTHLTVKVTKDQKVAEDLRAFEAYEMAMDLKNIHEKIPNLYSVTCEIDRRDHGMLASIEWHYDYPGET